MYRAQFYDSQQMTWYSCVVVHYVSFFFSGLRRKLLGTTGIMAQYLGKTVETGGSSVYGGRLAAKEPK